MRLHDLLADLPIITVARPTDTEITSRAYHSRAVRPGGLFVAINGFHADGHTFIPQAIARGAAAIVYQDDLRPPVATQRASQITWVRVPASRIALAPLAAAFYGHPARSMR